MENKDEFGQPGQLLIYKDGAANLQVRLDGKTVWLTQKLMAELYQVTIPNINQHLAAIYEDSELSPQATIKRYLIVQKEGSREVTRSVEHYNLDAIIAVGYRVRSELGTRFRQWATSQLRDLLVKGFVLDDERMKSGKSIGEDYFDELLARIRDIRSSEQLFYKKILAIYATSIDYDPTAEITKTFFKTVQNKLHFAVHGKTAAEVVKGRANADKPMMGLTNWKNAPEGPVRKADVSIAKNYLSKDELDELNRIVGMYLDYAEDMAKKKKPMHMREWIEKLDAFLKFNERNILKSGGSVSHALAEAHAMEEFAKYESQRLADHDATKTEFDALLDQSKRVGKLMPKPKSKPESKNDEPK